MVKDMETHVPIKNTTTTNWKAIEGPCVEDRFDLVLEMSLWPHELRSERTLKILVL